MSLTIHWKCKYFDSTLQRAEDRRQKFYFIFFIITMIFKSIDKVYVIYSKGFREGPSNVTRISRIIKLMKTMIFMIIRKITDKIDEIYLKG